MPMLFSQLDAAVFHFHSTYLLLYKIETGHVLLMAGLGGTWSKFFKPKAIEPFLGLFPTWKQRQNLGSDTELKASHCQRGGKTLDLDFAFYSFMGWNLTIQ